MLGANDHLVVVGASLAGLRAVEAARNAGFEGRLTLVGAEQHLPYDRPPLTKEFLGTGDEPDVPELRAEETYANELGVTPRLGTRATGLDCANRTVELDDGTLGYDALILATGSTARHLPGTDDARALPGLHRLRTLDDARAVRRALDAGARLVVVGAGFIGSEVASAARARGLDVTVLEAAEVPMAGAVGAQMGSALAEMHVRAGTELRLGVSVEAIEGDERVEGVRLADGTVLPADLVVVGVGAEPAIDWLGGSEVTCDGGVRCDEYLATTADGVYAAGDIASWVNPLFERRMRLEHWTTAAEQGGAAARNAVNPEEAKPYSTVPYFWSDLYGSRVQLVGVPDGEVTIVHGDPDEGAFLALFCADDRLVGALGVDQLRVIPRCRSLIGNRSEYDAALQTIEKKLARR